MDEEREYRQKVMKIGSVSIGICLLLAYWYATQSVAAECEYNPALGTCLSFGDIHIYQPFQYYFWQQDARISEAIPEVLGGYAFYPYLAVVVGGGFTYLCTQGLKKETSHGSASFASKKEIDETGLGMYEDKVQKEKRKILGIIPYTKKVRKPKTSGVVVGVNPYTHKLMLHDGVEHMLLMAPTRSGKGVNTIIPTGLVWRHSIFFFDVKGELWQATSGFRQKVLGQKVMKFAPLCGDGSSARWNPLAEINFQTPEELGDVSTIVGIMVKPDGEKQGGGDPFWDNSASALLSGVIMHLMYKHNKEKLRLPCPTDIMSFLSSPDKTTKELFTAMRDYPHISPEEFLELPDEQGKPRINPLKLVYGEYVMNLKPFSDALGKTVHNLEEIRLAILESKEKICWDAPPPKDDNGFGDEEENAPPPPPFYMLLVHPKVAECASNMLNGAEQTRASIMQTAQTALALYQNPVVQKNTEVSDFCIRDLLSPKDTVSLYLCMQTNEVQTLKPLSRLLINTMLQKLIRDMKFDTSGGASMKQRLLLLLDEFPQLGNLKAMELALAVCAGYGIKVCIVAQDVNQLNKEYTKDNSIASNCHVHIYFTPNLDSGGATAEAISKNLGKHTIKTVSHSDGGGLFKGSNSESFTGRELMTADEVSHMSSEKELVFVAGHKPIFGDKLRYYLQPFFLKRLNMYQGIYIKEHGCEAACKKYTSGGKHDCARCVEEYKKSHDLPPIPCPTYPLYSDHVTRVLSFEDLFAVHAADKEELSERSLAVQMEKEHQMRLDEEAGNLVSENSTATEPEPTTTTTEKEGISLEKKEPPGDQIPGDANLPEDTAGNEQTEDDTPRPEQTVTESTADEGSRGKSTEPEIDAKVEPVDLFGGDESKTKQSAEEAFPPQEVPDAPKEVVENKSPSADDVEPIPASEEDSSVVGNKPEQEGDSVKSENVLVEEVPLSREEFFATELPQSRLEPAEGLSEAGERAAPETEKSNQQPPAVPTEAKLSHRERIPRRSSGFHESPYRREWKTTEDERTASDSGAEAQPMPLRTVTLSSILDRHKPPVAGGRSNI